MDSPEQKFFVSDDGKEKLSITKAELQAGINSGKHTDKTLAWTKGMNGWLPLSDPSWEKHGIRVRSKQPALPPHAPEEKQTNVWEASGIETVSPDSDSKAKLTQSNPVPHQPTKSGVSKVLIGMLCLGLLLVLSVVVGLVSSGEVDNEEMGIAWKEFRNSVDEGYVYLRKGEKFIDLNNLTNEDHDEFFNIVSPSWIHFCDTYRSNTLYAIECGLDSDEYKQNRSWGILTIPLYAVNSFGGDRSKQLYNNFFSRLEPKYTYKGIQYMSPGNASQ